MIGVNFLASHLKV